MQPYRICPNLGGKCFCSGACMGMKSSENKSWELKSENDALKTMPAPIWDDTQPVPDLPEIALQQQIDALTERIARLEKRMNEMWGDGK